MDVFDQARQPSLGDAIDFGLSVVGASGQHGHVGDQRVTMHSGLPLQCVGGRPETIEISEARRYGYAAKRLMDCVLSMIALLALAPLLAFCALAIVLETRGPVFFKQLREGLNGELFWAYKFRSMRADAGDASGVAHTVPQDKRVTRVGAFLRRTSIDELPQLLNVLFGEMSLVGPRPHVPGMRAAGGAVYSEFVPYYADRLAMLPGITGWAQANGYRGDASDPVRAKARIDHDIAYIQNFSVLLDLRIIWLTVRREFIGGSGH